MHRPSSILIACLSAAVLAGADPADSKLPPAAAAAIDALQKEIGRNYATYHTAVQKASERTAKDLNRAMVEATKKGDLDTATAVKAALEELNAGKMQDRLESVVRQDVDLLGDAVPSEDALKTSLSKGDWILDRAGERNLLHFERWTKPEADPSPHWTANVGQDVTVTLAGGARLHLRSAIFGLDQEFVSDPKTGRLNAANGWSIRHPNANEELPPPLDANPDGGQGRIRGPGGRRR